MFVNSIIATFLLAIFFTGLRDYYAIRMQQHAFSHKARWQRYNNYWHRVGFISRAYYVIYVAYVCLIMVLERSYLEVGFYVSAAAVGWWLLFDPWVSVLRKIDPLYVGRTAWLDKKIFELAFYLSYWLRADISARYVGLFVKISLILLLLIVYKLIV